MNLGSSVWTEQIKPNNIILTLCLHTKYRWWSWNVSDAFPHTRFSKFQPLFLTFMKVCSLQVGWASGRGSHSSLLRNTICMQMIWARRLNRAYNGLPSIITGAKLYSASIWSVYQMCPLIPAGIVRRGRALYQSKCPCAAGLLIAHFCVRNIKIISHSAHVKLH